MKYLVFLFMLPAFVFAQFDRDEGNALRLLTWEYNPTTGDADFGDSTLICSPGRAISISRISLRFDSLWTWSDSVKVGTSGISMVRPANIFGCSKANRGSDSTQAPAAFIQTVTDYISSGDVYLYHLPAGGRVGTATITIEYRIIGPANTVKKSTGM